MDAPPNNKGHDTVSANRQIKDGVFRILFDNPENAAELYHALSGEICTPEEIQIITLTTVVSGRLKNDLAFIVRGRALVVGEHMSSSYANMPIRILMYTGQLYDKWFKMKGEEKFLFSGTLYKIPTPEFVVFYNGETPKPEKETLRLSSAYTYANDGKLGFLELEIPVYNINNGMNEDLFKKSPQLKQYAEFIAKLREFNKACDNYTQAVEKAVKHCIDNNILSDFLKKHGGAIVSILEMEYDVEAAKRVYAEEKVEDIAKEMIADGEPIEKIAKWTKLSVDTIRGFLDGK